MGIGRDGDMKNGTGSEQFAIETEYTQVLEYLTLVGGKFRTLHSYHIDRTGLGEVFDEFARKHGLKNVKGIVLTMQTKQEVMTCLKQIMLEKRLHLPRDRELENEMNGEISEQTKTGKTKFYHRSGTHDDRLWAVALAVYAGRTDIVEWCYTCNHAKLPGTQHACPGQLPR